MTETKRLRLKLRLKAGPEGDLQGDRRMGHTNAIRVERKMGQKLLTHRKAEGTEVSQSYHAYGCCK